MASRVKSPAQKLRAIVKLLQGAGHLCHELGDELYRVADVLEKETLDEQPD